MKFFAATATILASIASVFGQSVVINPVNGLTAHPNTPYTFELDRPNFQSSSLDVAAVVGFQSCTTPEGCANGFFGEVLYNGIYRPVNDPNPQKRQNMNITVTIPASASGFGRLTVTHFALVGASLNTPGVDTSNVTLTIV